MTLHEVALKAIKIYSAHEEAAGFDSGFDGGEFSGPAHSRMADDEVENLAISNGFSIEEVDDEVRVICEE